MLNYLQKRRLRETAAHWFFRLQSLEEDHPERSKFERWLLESPAHQHAYAEIETLWDTLDSPAALDNLATGLQQRKIRESSKVRTGISLLGMVLVVCLGVHGYQYWQAQPLSHMAAIGQTGTISTRHLDDGSKLTLNAKSELDITYYRHKRLVVLKQGEAVFEVVPDTGRPFIVDAGTTQVTVLGTRFAVNRLQPLVRVSVDHGKVKVASMPQAGQPTSPPLLLKDGQVAEVIGHHPPVMVERAAADAFSFTQGVITFHKEELPVIAETLSRYVQSPIELQFAENIHTRLTARIKTRNVQQFMHSLPELAPVTVKQEASRTLISGQTSTKK